MQSRGCGRMHGVEGCMCEGLCVHLVLTWGSLTQTHSRSLTQTHTHTHTLAHTHKHTAMRVGLVHWHGAFSWFIVMARRRSAIVRGACATETHVLGHRHAADQSLLLCISFPPSLPSAGLLPFCCLALVRHHCGGLWQPGHIHTYRSPQTHTNTRTHPLGTCSCGAGRTSPASTMTKPGATAVERARRLVMLASSALSVALPPSGGSNRDSAPNRVLVVLFSVSCLPPLPYSPLFFLQAGGKARLLRSRHGGASWLSHPTLLSHPRLVGKSPLVRWGHMADVSHACPIAVHACRGRLWLGSSTAC